MLLVKPSTCLTPPARPVGSTDRAAPGVRYCKPDPVRVNALNDQLAKLGIEIDPQLLDLAFTHRSWAYENGRGDTNERLEFLGDSVLGAVVTERIFTQYAERPEGQLAKLRAAVVSGTSLAGVARELDLGASIKLGRGEVVTHGEAKDSILADALEAVIGAVHLTGGFAMAAAFVDAVMGSLIARAAELGAGLDWKSSLQELAAANNLGVPTYVVSASGPDHERRFVAECHVDHNVFGPGEGSSRRGAEQRAAEIAYAGLQTKSAGES